MTHVEAERPEKKRKHLNVYFVLLLKLQQTFVRETDCTTQAAVQMCHFTEILKCDVSDVFIPPGCIYDLNLSPPERDRLPSVRIILEKFHFNTLINFK